MTVDYLIVKTADALVETARLEQCDFAEALREGGLTKEQVESVLAALDAGEARALAPNVVVWRLHEAPR